MVKSTSQNTRMTRKLCTTKVAPANDPLSNEHIRNTMCTKTAADVSHLLPLLDFCSWRFFFYFRTSWLRFDFGKCDSLHFFFGKFKWRRRWCKKKIEAIIAHLKSWKLQVTNSIWPPEVALANEKRSTNQWIPSNRNDETKKKNNETLKSKLCNEIKAHSFFSKQIELDCRPHGQKEYSATARMGERFRLRVAAEKGFNAITQRYILNEWRRKKTAWCPA